MNPHASPYILPGEFDPAPAQLRRSTCILLACLVLPSIASAQWPHRDDLIKLLTSTDTLAELPAVAPDGAGGVTIAWRDNRNSVSTGRDIYAQRINAKGVEQWTADGAPVIVADGVQGLVLLAPGASGSVYAVWSDERTANQPRIRVQRLNGAGKPQWSADGVRAGLNEFNQTDHAVAGDTAGNLFVTWREDGNNFATFVQKIDASGARLWGDNGVQYSSGVFAGGSIVNVVSDGAGGAVVAWIEFGDSPRTLRIQRFLTDGMPAFDSVAFGEDSEALINILPLAADGTGGAIAGWEGDNGTNDNLFVQCVNGTGDLPWGDASTQLVDQTNVQDNLHLVADGAGGVYAAWDDPRTGVDNTYVQHLNASGIAQWDANGIPAGVASAQRFNSLLIGDEAGGAIVTYRQNQDGLWAQRFNAAGDRLWTDAGVPFTTNASVTQAVTTTDGVSGIIVGVISFSGGNIPAVKRLTAEGAFPQSRLANISTRAFVGTGANLAIPGFVISGTGSKTLLIRAVGPTLADEPYNVPGVLGDPVLTIYDGAQQSIATRNDWGEAGDAGLVKMTSDSLGAFTLPDASKDAAMVADFAPGLYTAGIVGAGDTTGVGLIEVYDGDPASSPSQLVNISSRVFVGTGDALAIPGLVIAGPATMTLLIRAVGPTLAGEPYNVPGVLTDPVLTLYDVDGNPLMTNDDWQDGGSTAADALAAAAAQVEAFALEAGSADAALLTTLAPGSYTAGVVGAGDGTGVCLVEAYLVP